MAGLQSIEGWSWFSAEVIRRERDGVRVAKREEVWRVTDKIGQLALGADGRPATFDSVESACKAADHGRLRSEGWRVWLLEPVGAT